MNRKNWKEFQKNSAAAEEIYAVLLDAFHSGATGEPMQPQNRRNLETALDVLRRNGIAEVSSWDELMKLKQMIS